MNRLHRWYCRSSFWKQRVRAGHPALVAERGGPRERGSGSGAWPRSDDRLVAASVREYRLSRNRSGIGRLSPLSHGQHQCQCAMRRCDGNAVSRPSIFWRSLVHDAPPHTLPCIAGSALRGGSPGAQTRWCLCRNRQHEVHLDEDLPHLRHNDSGGSRNIASQT